jgi:nucleoside triphosphatase
MSNKKQIFPEPTVGALIFNKKNEILLVKSHKWKGMYVVPGGHVELGESMANALKREILEETGLRIYDVKYLMHQEFIYGNDFWKKRHFIFFDFSCKTKNDKIKLNHESEEYVWAPVDKTLKMNVEPYTINAIKEYIRINK